MAPTAAAARPEFRATPRRRILFVGGSFNQTTMVHRIAGELAGHERVFTPYYADGLLRLGAEAGLLGFTILGGRPKAMSEAFLREQGATIDPRGAGGGWDLVVTASDLVVPRNLRAVPTEDRDGFIRRCLEVAGGRELLFKLHPNENHARARREIERLAPRALVFDSGNTNHMIANCAALVTRYSSVVHVAVALGKEVHADLDPVTLRRLVPIQNGGTSARRIADIFRRFLG